MKRVVRLTVSELESLLKSWALNHELLVDEELAVLFGVRDGQLTSVELHCESDEPSVSCGR